MNYFPFEASIDGQIFDRWETYALGQKLEVRILPRNEWPDVLRQGLSDPIHIHLFETSANRYKPLSEELEQMTGNNVMLGDIPTLRAHKHERYALDLKPGNFYDVLSIASCDGDIVLAAAGGFSTQQVQTPELLTLDQLKLVAIEYLGLTMEQARAIKATIGRAKCSNGSCDTEAALFHFGDYGVVINGGEILMPIGGLTKDIRQYLLREFN